MRSPARKELSGLYRMPLDILHPRCVLVIRSHDGVVFLQPSIEDLDRAVGKARQERRRGTCVGYERRDGTFRVRVQVLYNGMSS